MSIIKKSPVKKSDIKDIIKKKKLQATQIPASIENGCIEVDDNVTKEQLEKLFPND